MSNWSEASFYDWDVERMVMWLREESLHDCVRPFQLKRINGISFVRLSDFDIKTFQISQESKDKLTKVLKRIKGKKRNVHRSIEDESSTEIRRPRSPAVNHHEEGDEGWGSDFSDCEEDEDSGSGSDGEYIEPEHDNGNFGPPESPNKEVPNVPIGLVAQLRAGLNGTIKGNPFSGPPASHSHPKTLQAEDDNEDIYDVPPDEEEEVYEQPSDDSGSGIVVRPMSKRKVIRCPSQEAGEYIDARPPTNSDQDVGPCPPPPRPPKPGQKSKGIKPPPMRQPSPPREQEIYDEVPEDEQPGCSQVVEEYEPFPSGGQSASSSQVVEEYEAFDSSEQPASSSHVVEEYEPFASSGQPAGSSHVIEEYEPFASSGQPAGSSHVVEEYEPFASGGTWDQETYEIPDACNGSQDTYEVPEPEAEPETYEIPDPEPAAPARPPPRGSGWNPLKKKTPVPDKGKPPSLTKEPVKQKPAKPVPAAKPQISPKPSPPKAASIKKTPGQQNRTSRLYPSNTGPTKPPPSQKPSPAKKEENNNEKNSPAPKVPPQRRAPPTSPTEDSPPSPPPPRPGPKPGARPPPFKAPPPSISNSNIPVGPTSPPRNAPLPPLPTQPKSPVDPLKDSPWFQGPLDKKIAEAALKSFSKEGAFIVRNSSSDPNNYSMSLFSKGSVRHLRIPRINGKFVLGDSGKVQFNTIPEMVDYYSQHHVDLKSGGSTSLTAACPVK